MRFVQIVITLLIISSASHKAFANVLPSGIRCAEAHPLECALKTLQPALNMAGGEARLLSNLIYKYSKKYNVDPYRVIAIAMQESGLKNINRKHDGIITDVGLYQFNVLTIDAYGLDFNRLQSDIAYQTERACWLLSKKLKDCQEFGGSAWRCYHSKTLSHGLKYEQLVNRYYNKIISDQVAGVADVK